MTTRSPHSLRSVFWLASAVLIAGFGFPASVQGQPFQCLDKGVINPPVVRAEGHTELIGDLVLDCTGGVPTPPGQGVPPVNITVNLDTFLSSKVTAVSNQVQFLESLLIVDEPNSASNPTSNPTRPLLNCGHDGAPDNTAAGPGVCQIMGRGANGARNSYDGTPGYPNVFQGRSLALLTGQTNQVAFLGVPIDPPGTLCPASDPGNTGTVTVNVPCHRILRITNIRADAVSVGVSLYSSAQITAQIIVNPISGLPIDNPEAVVAYVMPGMTASVTGSNGATSPVRILEGFAGSWKTKNVSFTVGDNNGLLGNATLQGNTWAYNGNAGYPADDAQNVAGTNYFTESGFEWRNNSTNPPPSINPPPGYGSFPVPNIGNPFNSVGLGGTDTDINNAGVANSASRVAIRFNNIPSGASVQVPQQVTLYRQGCASLPSCATGVMVLTAADSAGAGAFTPAVTTVLTSGNNLAIYEILYTDPFHLEFADVPFTLLNAAPGTAVQVAVGFAPFYSGSQSEQASSIYPIPRFVDRSVSAPCSSAVCLTAFPNEGTNPTTVAGLTCVNSSGVPPTIRAEGLAEILGDIVLDCQGGIPTPAGQAVPQLGITVNLDTFVTSKLTGGNLFTEALLLVDEPNSPANPSRPILNCGHDGAPDSPTGAGVCSVISTGDPATTYDGTKNGFGAAAAICDGANGRPATNSYGCGRPNVFQARIGSSDDPNRTNTITFFGVPIDPPGANAHRILRITNMRGNPATTGVTSGNQTSGVSSVVSVFGSNAVTIVDPQHVVARVQLGMTAPSVTNSTVTLREAFANSFKPRSLQQVFNNGVTNPYHYTSGSPNTTSVTTTNQNVPGAYYDTESGFMNPNTASGGNPPTNPLVPGIGAGVPFVDTTSGGGTGILLAGIADAGTRLAIRFTNIPAGASVQVPQVVQLTNVINPAQATGVMVLSSTDAAGAGPYSPASGILTPASNMAVYEVLFSNPGALEQGTIPYTLLNAPPNSTLQITSSYAPFYSTAAAGHASLTLPVPRFTDPLGYVPCGSGPCISVSPDNVTDPGLVTIVLSGGPILNNAQVKLSGAGFPDIFGSSSSNPNPSLLATQFNLTGAPVGVRDVVVTPQVGSPFTLPHAFQILASAPCSYEVGPLNPTVPGSGGSGDLVVTPSKPICAWGASTSTSWITLPPKSNSVTQPYTVAANPSTSPRDGTITIAGRNVAVTQTGACSYDISPPSQIFSAGGGTVSVNVSAPAGCAWSAVSSTTWITVTAGASGSGIGWVTLQADPNSGGLRSGTVTIAGKTFAGSQSASACGAADVSSQVSVARGAIASNFIGTSYVQQVRLTNQGAAIPGPVYLVVDGLPKTGTPCVGTSCGIIPPPQITFCQSPSGSSLVLAAPNGLTAGQLVTLSLTFQPGLAAKGVPPIWTTTRVFSGTPSQ